jgi:hypothetical protein
VKREDYNAMEKIEVRWSQYGVLCLWKYQEVRMNERGLGCDVFLLRSIDAMFTNLKLHMGTSEVHTKVGQGSGIMKQIFVTYNDDGHKSGNDPLSPSVVFGCV